MSQSGKLEQESTTQSRARTQASAWAQQRSRKMPLPIWALVQYAPVALFPGRVSSKIVLVLVMWQQHLAGLKHNTKPCHARCDSAT